MGKPQPHVQTEHLTIAWSLVQRGSRAAGVDGITVDLFAGDATAQIQQLRRQLQRESDIAKPAKGFYRPKQSGGQRLIGIPTVGDRIVQRYLLQAIYPALDRALSPVSYAYRPGYSTHLAVERVMAFYRHPVWVLKTDIQQFFDRLCWSLLLHHLEQLKLSPMLVRLIEQQLKSGLVIHHQFQPTNQGVLQGGILSGALANLYLSEFDRRCLAAGLPLVRYGDDCLVICPGWTEANRACANTYFQAFALLLKPPFEFAKRTRRPPTDPVNSLLSLGYTLLAQNIHSMVEVSGLHTHLGNLHTPRENHPALVSDLMEEFRAFVVDSLVLYLTNGAILTPEDFTPPDERGGVYLHPDALKRFLKHWEDKLQTEIVHPYAGYRVNYRRCMELQVWEYIACLVGDRDVYRPMKWEL